MSDLLPCPFCGAELENFNNPIGVARYRHPRPMAPAGLRSCIMEGVVGTRDEWNTRAGTRTPAPGGALVEVARECADALDRLIPAKQRGPWKHGYGCPAETPDTDNSPCTCGAWEQIDKDRALLARLRALLQEGTGG